MIRIHSPCQYTINILSLVIGLILLFITCQISAEDISIEKINLKPRPSINALRVEIPPVIDGSLDEAVWENASVGGDFIQFEPIDNIAMSERTEFRILYDNKAIYIGIWAFDSEPEKILARIRYRQPLKPAQIFMGQKGLYLIFDKKQKAISSGQFAAWYKGKELIGSGIIY